MVPTDYEIMHLFYPDFSPGATGCRNDGSEPTYMLANPSYYLSSTMDKCCKTYFGWNYNVCMGNTPGICSRALWYPDWEGSSGGCISDGNEPQYMTNNAVQYMFIQLFDCCSQHYGHSYRLCTFATATLNAGLYYPDFEGSENICRTGGGQPQYMNYSPSVWMHSTLVSQHSTKVLCIQTLGE